MQRRRGADSPAVRGLAELAELVCDGSAGPGELFEAFLSATVFCERPERPGFVAVGEAGEGLVPVFSSLEELARYVAARGDHQEAACRWFSTAGSDLLDLLPEGYDLVLDPASGRGLRLRAAAWRPRPAVAVSPSGASGEYGGA